MKLYTSPASPYARKVMVTAHERGLAGRIEQLNFEPFKDPSDLIAVNALGKVPALRIEDGTILYDSPVICAYLDAHPDAQGPALVPASGPERWLVLRAEALADGIMDLGLNLTTDRRKPEVEQSPTSVARWRMQTGNAIDALAKDVAGKPPVSDLGQLAGAVALAYLDYRHPYLEWRTSRPLLADWYDAIAARPSMRATALP